MKHSVGLDVSVKETAICIVDEGGKVVRETEVATEPEVIVAFLNDAGLEYARIGLEAGPLSQWLVNGLAEAGLPVICVETRHMKAVEPPRVSRRPICLSPMRRYGSSHAGHSRQPRARREGCSRSAREGGGC
jgi:transposase